MINAYVVGISNHYEGEDIEIRYSIYKDQELKSKKSVFHKYKKPLVVSHVAVLTLLKELKKYKDKEVVILINDASLNEQIRGISQTKKADVLEMADKVKQELNKFGESVIIEDVSTDSVKLREWNDALKF